MICGNILANLLAKCIESILDLYGKVHNMNKDARATLAMKNEFLFKRLFLMNKKKRYATSIVLREGHVMIPYKTDIKGVDFIKSGVSDYVTEKFTKMLEDNVLFPDEIQLRGLMKDLKAFEREIYDDLKKGGTTFLRPHSVKSGAAYKNPWSQQVFKAVELWNAIYPNKKIYTLEKAPLVKLNISTIDGFDKLIDKYPEEHAAIISGIGTFQTNQQIYFEKLKAAKMAKGENPDDIKVPKLNFSVIAIPSTLEVMPEWIRELVDYETIVSDVFSSFRSVMDAFQLEEISIKTANGKANLVSPLISL
jgi:hypothetical protein